MISKAIDFLLENYETLATGFCVGLLLYLVFFTRINFFASLAACVLLFIGLILISSFWTQLHIQQKASEKTEVTLGEEIYACRMKAGQIAGVNNRIQDQAIQERIRAILKQANDVINELSGDDTRIEQKARVMMYVDKLLILVESYAKIAASGEGLKKLTKNSIGWESTELLDLAETGMQKAFDDYLQNRVVELKTMGRVLRKMVKTDDKSTQG